MSTDKIHELRLEIAKNLTVDKFIEITEAQVRAEAEIKQLNANWDELKEYAHRCSIITWLKMKTLENRG